MGEQCGHERVVSGSQDRTVRVWDAQKSSWESTVLAGHEDRVNSVAMSADGAQVVSGSLADTVQM